MLNHSSHTQLICKLILPLYINIETRSQIFPHKVTQQSSRVRYFTTYECHRTKPHFTHTPAALSLAFLSRSLNSTPMGLKKVNKIMAQSAKPSHIS